MIKKISIICFSLLFVSGCAGEIKNSRFSLFMNTQRTFTVDKTNNKEIVTEVANIDTKAFRTATGATLAIVTLDPWMAAAGALPEAVDTGGEIVKQSLAKEPNTVYLTPQRIQPSNPNAKPIPSH